MSSNSFSQGEQSASHSPPTIDRNHPHVLQNQRAVLQRLKAWHQWEEDRQKSLADYLLRTPPAFIPRPPLPTDEELLSMARYFFPLRDELEVTVCDFDAPKDGFCAMKRHDTILRYLDQYMKEKPSSVYFRWIHVPVGAGRLNSVINLSFNAAKIGSHTCAKPLYFKVLSLRYSDIVQDQLDVFNLLQDVPTYSVQRYLGEAWVSERYSTHLVDGATNFWKAATSDIPGPLAQTTMMDQTRIQRGQTSKDFLSTKQCLSRHPDLENLMLTTDNMTCLRRSNGILLTMLSSKGLNFLAGSTTPIPWPNVMCSPYEFVLGSFAKLRWPHFYGITRHLTVPIEALSHNQFIELLLLDIVLGFHDTPVIRTFDKVGIEEAYEQIVIEMKNRGARRLRRQDSLALVQDYIACMNEISQLLKVTETKKHFLRELTHDFPTFPVLSVQESAEVNISNRNELIESNINSRHAGFERLPLLSEELKSSLDVLFQLKTIEQNELALLAESNNQAILVFTVVTVIFLPLSFFTSYFGMNLQGIVDTNKSERYFWAVCGPTAVSIVLLTLLFGFRKRFGDALWSDQTFSRSRNQAKKK